MNILDLWLKFMKWGLVITPPVIVILFIALPIADAVRPWNLAESQLELYGRAGPAICVGMYAFHSRTTNEVISETQRSYLLMARGEVVSITETHENGETTVSVDATRWEFWILPAVFLLFIWLSFGFSIPRIASKFNPC